MNFNDNPVQSTGLPVSGGALPGQIPSSSFGGSNAQYGPPLGAIGANTQVATQYSSAGSYMSGLQGGGVISLIGLSLRCLDDISTIAGRAMEGAQNPDYRQALWQIRQLAGQAQAQTYQIRGMLLQ